MPPDHRKTNTLNFNNNNLYFTCKTPNKNGQDLQSLSILLMEACMMEIIHFVKK